MVRFKKVRQSRTVPHTVGGVTYDVTEQHEARQVVQPLDLDAIVARLLGVLTMLVVTGALVWSTVAIGGLLSRMAPVWVSYTVSGVFDLAWVACMGAEWLFRYDRKRARVPYWAGWAFLAVSVLAIATEGYLATHQPVVGSAGGLVSVLSKGLWMVVMSVSAQRMSPLDEQWYEQASSAAGAQLAMAAAQRKLLRTQARIQQERAALSEFLDLSGTGPAALPPVPDIPALPVPGPQAPVLDVSGTAAPARDEDAPPVPDTAAQAVPVPDLSLGQKRELTELVRNLRDEGLDEGDIKERVLRDVPKINRDSLRKAIQRTRPTA